MRRAATLAQLGADAAYALKTGGINAIIGEMPFRNGFDRLQDLGTRLRKRVADPVRKKIQGTAFDVGVTAIHNGSLPDAWL